MTYSDWPTPPPEELPDDDSRVLGHVPTGAFDTQLGGLLPA
jgi:hypothetical protein